MRGEQPVDGEDPVLCVEDTKTRAGERTVEVPELIQPYLAELKEGKKPEKLLFGYHYRDWVREWVQRICDRAGVPSVTAPGMRGLHGSIAVERGATGHLVAGALGHESERTTFQSYVSQGAAAKAKQQRLIDALARQPDDQELQTQTPKCVRLNVFQARPTLE